MLIKDLFDLIVLGIRKFFGSRLLIIGIFAMCLFGALIMRLYTLQIIEGDSYQAEYEQTSSKTVSEDYTRGTIYDRNGKALAYNRLSYNVQVVDDGTYNAYERNEMILRLITILDKYKEDYSYTLSIEYNDDGYEFTTSSDRALSRFLQDVGVYSTDPEVTTEKLKHELDWYTADYVVEQLAERYGIGITIVNGHKEQTYSPDPEQLLKIIDMRYALSLNSGQKYIAATVAKDVSSKTVSDIMEHEYELKGVTVEPESIRTYVGAKYFAHIVGYTGQINQTELESKGDEYSAGDIIGKAGIEYSFEDVLKGTKGSKSLVVNSSGIVLSETVTKEPEAGGDVYLTIDYKYQKAAYNILEQHLAGILASKIVNYNFKYRKGMASSDIMIPVKDVYYQLIGNNILDMNHFKRKKASATEKAIYKKYTTKQKRVLRSLKNILLSDNSKVNTAYSKNMQDTLNYAFNLLISEGILKEDSIDKNSEIYQKWTNDKVSLRTFLVHALTNGWVDVSQLNIKGQYTDTSETLKALVKRLQTLMKKDTTFQKLVYRFLIQSGTISGRELCLALYDQKILKKKNSDYTALKNGTMSSYTFIVKKIKKLELTPAQIALDPCSGSIVMTDTKTGQVLALATYPSYDNNKITTDSSYLSKLTTDQSLPLYSRATQTKTAPGSIFKPITALAGMKEGVLGVNEEIETARNGIFTEAGYNLACSISPRNHGTLGISEALQKSCNYFFSEVAYRLSLKGNGKYSEAKGIKTLQKYAKAFGLNQNSGIEISEAQPQVTTTDAVPSGIGQGTNNYTNTQINRYVTTIANRGTCLDLNLMLKTTDHNGKVLTKNKKTVVSKTKFSDAQWDAVYKGMYLAVNENQTYKEWFASLPVKVAGKTGTAQENKSRGNHANFICFAPYKNPKVAVSVSIPYGYTAANSVSVASDVLRYYYGKLSMKTIMKKSANTVSRTSDPAD